MSSNKSTKEGVVIAFWSAIRLVIGGKLKTQN